ncbi:MAG: selenide, water dikinase SelD [Planctomycetes bacterium]|nr:selenide, water dikinase SelD [Planctomycetota bacterium]
MSNIRLTSTVQSGGCAAKLSPDILSSALRNLPISRHPNLLVGLARPDDAGVYKLSPEIAIIQTVDFFPPIVDQPYLFGQIAATNALSDVYAMGGKPITAMNVVGFPASKFPLDVLREMLRGGMDKIQESGAVLVGGHTINDTELKYGLSVTGTVHPDEIITNSQARPGDCLILTKPLGTGVFTSALKAGRVKQDGMKPVIKSMLTLNRIASEIAVKMKANACTDVTGFSFIGHSYLMASNSRVSMVIDHQAVPMFDGALELSKAGFVPCGTRNNRRSYQRYVSMPKGLPEEMVNLLFDPQTSGGLLISVPQNKAQLLLQKLRAKGIKEATIIGRVIKPGKKRITVI